MKYHLPIVILCVSFINFNCHREELDPNSPVIKIEGLTPAPVSTSVGKTIKFHQDTLELKIISVDNHLCPSDPHINCIYGGYLTLTLKISSNLGSGSATLRNGQNPLWGNFPILNDSATLSLSDFPVQIPPTYRIYLTGSAYYMDDNHLDINLQLKSIL